MKTDYVMTAAGQGGGDVRANKMWQEARVKSVAESEIERWRPFAMAALTGVLSNSELSQFKTLPQLCEYVSEIAMALLKEEDELRITEQMIAADNLGEELEKDGIKCLLD